MIIKISSPFLLRLFWGKRIAVSDDVDPYPEAVYATWRTWLQWGMESIRNRRNNVVYEVYAPRRNKERIERAVDAVYERERREQEAARKMVAKLSPEQFQRLLNLREKYRRQRRFDRSDAIRNWLEAQGVQVFDDRIRI